MSETNERPEKYSEDFYRDLMHAFTLNCESSFDLFEQHTSENGLPDLSNFPKGEGERWFIMENGNFSEATKEVYIAIAKWMIWTKIQQALCLLGKGEEKAAYFPEEMGESFLILIKYQLLPSYLFEYSSIEAFAEIIKDFVFEILNNEDLIWLSMDNIDDFLRGYK